jgi:hypothetical protein
LGYIKGLPQDFTTNGAVVTTEGKILVSSAVNGNAISWLIQKIGVLLNTNQKRASSAVLILLTVIICKQNQRTQPSQKL